MPRSPSQPANFRGIFRTDDLARAVYSEAAGIARIIPAAIAVPEDARDTATLVRWARDTSTALIPRGSGSSMAGGAIGHGVIVDLSRLRDIGPVDVERRRVVAGPGAVRGDVDRAARALGLRFPVDPSSGKFCSVGGMAATNAAGSHSMYFGPMRKWVHAITCIFDDGSSAEVRRGTPPPEHVPAVSRFLRDAESSLIACVAAGHGLHAGVLKDSSGYAIADYAQSRELIDLLVGSEGTLALFTELELDLTPVPGATSSVLAAFPTLEKAVAGATAARAHGAVACELLDRTFLDIAAHREEGSPVAADAEAALLAEVEGSDEAAAAAAARRIEQLFRDSGAAQITVALDAHTETEIWELRHAASPILARLDPALRSMQFVEDAAVPPESLPEYVRGVREALARHGVRGVIFGHAGDSHVHVNPLVNVSQPGWRARVEGVLADVTSLTSSLHGTLTGEHGDGRLRTPLMPHVWDAESRECFARVKQSFDPTGILNPGVKIPVPGQVPLTEIKYDPELPPLPDAAVSALREVEGSRAYSSFRLDMLNAPHSDDGLLRPPTES